MNSKELKLLDYLESDLIDYTNQFVRLIESIDDTLDKVKSTSEMEYAKHIAYTMGLIEITSLIKDVLLKLKAFKDLDQSLLEKFDEQIMISADIYFDKIRL